MDIETNRETLSLIFKVLAASVDRGMVHGFFVGGSFGLDHGVFPLGLARQDLAIFCIIQYRLTSLL
jgi:hypothetical protein